MNTNHPLPASSLEEPMSKQFQRKAAIRETGLIVTFALCLLSAVLLALTSCQSPIDIDTPKNVRPIETTSNPSSNEVEQMFEKTTQTLNGTEPEVIFTLTRAAQILRPNGQEFLYQNGSPTVFFKVNNASSSRTVRFTADSPNFQNRSMTSVLNGMGYILMPSFDMSGINTAKPVQFDATGYIPSETKIEWLDKVEITSHRNNLSNSFITRGQPLTVRWTTNISNADGAEIVIWGYRQSLRNDAGSTAAAIPEIELKRTLNSRNIREVQFTAEETNKLPVTPDGGSFRMRVRYFKTKTALDGKVALVSQSDATATGEVQ